MIIIDNLNKSFDQKAVLQAFSLTVNDREKIAIMGESGCGKTTLLRIIAGLEHPDGGRVERNESRFSYVFQESRLLDHLTVLDNVAIVLPVPLKQSRIRASEILREVGLYESAMQYPRELSGGMAQRVSLARAMMPNAPLLLLDEPFSALDGKTREDMIRVIAAFVADKTLIMVTHRKNDAERLCDRIVSLT